MEEPLRYHRLLKTREKSNVLESCLGDRDPAWGAGNPLAGTRRGLCILHPGAY